MSWFSVYVLRPNKCVLKLLILLITFLQMCFQGIKIILACFGSIVILCCAEVSFGDAEVSFGDAVGDVAVSCWKAEGAPSVRCTEQLVLE